MTDMTFTVSGDTCTLSMTNPEGYLRIKTYLPGMGVPVLQGKSHERRARYPKLASATFPLPPVGEQVRIDIYNGDGEGTGNRFAEYLVTENGLEVTRDQDSGIELNQEKQPAPRTLLAPHMDVELSDKGEVTIIDTSKDEYLPEFTILDALAATRLYDFLLRYMGRITPHVAAAQEYEDTRKYMEHQYEGGD